MRYLLAIILPPLAVLSCRKPFQAIANVLLTIFFWLPGVIHALCVVLDYKENQRTDRVIRELRSITSREVSRPVA